MQSYRSDEELTDRLTTRDTQTQYTKISQRDKVISGWGVLLCVVCVRSWIKLMLEYLLIILITTEKGRNNPRHDEENEQYLTMSLYG